MAPVVVVMALTSSVGVIIDVSVLMRLLHGLVRKLDVAVKSWHSIQKEVYTEGCVLHY